jgi:Xaa-Pro aminopeptidase
LKGDTALASEEEYREKRIRSLIESLRGRNLDAAWITGYENRRYLSGFRAEDSHPTESSGSLFISESSRILITDARFTLQAEMETSGFEIFTAKEGIVQALVEISARTGIKALAFEEDYLSWSLHQKLTKALNAGVMLEPLGRTVEGLRAVKDEVETGRLKAAADMISEILSEVINRLEPGMTERDASGMVEALARDAGADCLSFPPIVASGPNSALPHAVPSERRLLESEPIILDVGVRLKGYCSDITRTVFLGKPSEEFALVYETVRRAQAAGILGLKAGVESTGPDSAARRVISEAGYGDYFGHSLGHGIGLAAHEDPRLSPRNPVILKKGMVVTVEPGIYLPGKGGVRLEEMALVEEDGCRILTSEPHILGFSTR